MTEKINDRRLITAVEKLSEIIRTTNDDLPITDRVELALAVLPDTAVRELGIAGEVLAGLACDRLGVQELARPDVQEPADRLRDVTARFRATFGDAAFRGDAAP